MKTELLSLFVLIGFLSCTNHKQEIQKIPLTFQEIKIDSLLIGKSYHMLLVDSNLLIADTQCDSLFHWVNLNASQSKDVGKKGQGPEEYLDCDNFYRINDKYGFYDSKLRCLSEIRFGTENINLNKTVVYESLEYRYHNVVPTVFDSYIGIGPYKKGLFSISDSTGKWIKTVGEQPYRDAKERKISELARAMAYQGDVINSSKGDCLVHAIYTSPMIYFYRLSPDTVSLTNSLIDSYPEYKPELGNNSYASAMSRKNRLGYMALAATDDYVYALLSGKSTAEAGLSAFYGNIIRVFNWDGILQKEYVFDMSLTTFCVSSDDRTLYAIGLVDDYELVKAEL